MFLDASNFVVVSVDELLLEKAGFKHGYFTNLVPKKIVGKDGVERIYWVKPDAGKKPKLTRVVHHREGEEKDHHEDIKRDHVIDSKDMVRFSEGDKVKITWGSEKGREGVFRGSIAGPSPRVSVAFLNPKTGKHEAKTMNVNHIELVHRANDVTKKVVERKTVEVTNAKGETTLVDRGDYEMYYKDKERKKTIQERVAEEKTKLTVGGTYRRPDGRVFVVKSTRKVGTKMEYEVDFHVPGIKTTITKTIGDSLLQSTLKNQKYERVPRLHNPKAVGKPLSIELETGELHRKGHFKYAAGGYRQATKEDEDIARRILAEHWPMLEKTVSATTMKYPSVTEGDVTPATFIDALVKAVASYEPLLGEGSGIEERLRQYARSYARSEAVKIHEREMSTVRDDFLPDDTDKKSPLSSIDKTAVDEFLAGDSNDIIASPFVSKEEAILLEEGLADEADLMSWLYEDQKILDVMKRWTGIGVFQATLTRRQAAEELAGYVYNPKTMKPYATSTIETVLLPKELERIKEAFKAEASSYPDFKATLKKDVSLRSAMERKRKLAPVHPKDERVIKEVRTEMKKPDHRAEYAAQMIRLGIAPKDAPTIMQIGDRILAGSAVPSKYHTMLPRRLWETGSKALTAWFKERLPASVFSGKRAAALNLPSRFDVEKPIKAAIANEEREKEAQRQAASRNLARERKTVDI